MTRSTCTLLTLIGTVATLGLLISTASANHLSTSTRSMTETWSELRFLEPLGSRISCPLTLEGSLHSGTITKSAGALVGFITRASVINGSCTGSHVTILQASLPWHLQYRGFRGVLPDIEAVLLSAIGFAFRWEAPFGTCLFTSSGTQPLVEQYNLNSSHAVTGVEVAGSITSNEACGPFGERITGRLEGNSTTNTPQTITLI